MVQRVLPGLRGIVVAAELAFLGLVPLDSARQLGQWFTVIKDGAIYKMWYYGCNTDYTICSIGYATSPDGLAWTQGNFPGETNHGRGQGRQSFGH